MATDTSSNYFSVLQTVLCKAIQFCYGFLFGKFIWFILIHPYTRFYNFEQSTNLPELMFMLIISVIFMTFLSARAVMVLFLPSMIGNATQNYIIMLLFISLFMNPLANVALNAVETGRVIGCSIGMTFEQLKERAKLILNPIIEVINNENQVDLLAIEQDLQAVRSIIDEMRREAEFNKNQSDLSDRAILSNVSRPDRLLPVDTGDLKEVIERRLGVDANTTQDLVNRTKDFIKTASLDLDSDNLGLKVSVDVNELKRLMNSTKDVGKGKKLGDFNLTEIMYENCLGVFRETKSKCEEAVEDIRSNCRDTIGAFLAAIYCSPITYTLSSACPWLMNQLVDEVSLCNQMREFGISADVDPFNLTSGASNITSLYENLTRKLQELDDDLLKTESSSSSTLNRLELNISFNNHTKNLFFKTAELVKFLREKYSMRQAFYDLLLLLYEIYTSITFVYIMIQACRYRNNYLAQIRYDNHYITGLFLAIDKKRRLLKKASVLPLTKEESEKYITTFTCRRRTNEEYETQRSACIVVIVFLLFTLSLFYLDNIFYSLLKSIEEHALIQFKELGHHQVEVKVKGEGAVARLVRKLTSQLDSVYDLNRLSSTQECLPKPLTTNNSFYLEFALLVSAYTLIDQISIYAMRLRRITTAFFYPDKEKQRIIFLYKLILIQRQSLARTGVADLINEAAGPTSDRDEEVYTIRDAINYLRSCISQSLCCRRHNYRRL